MKKGVLYSLHVHVEDKSGVRILEDTLNFTKILYIYYLQHHTSIDSNWLILVSLWSDENSMSHPGTAFHFVFLVWKFLLPNIKCLSLSFSLHEAFNYQGWNISPRCVSEAAASLRDLSLFYCVYHLICTESLCFFFISFSTCSSPPQRLLCRVKGSCAERKVAGASQNIMSIPPSFEKLILSWRGKKKIKDADFTASHSHNLKLTHAI